MRPLSIAIVHLRKSGSDRPAWSEIASALRHLSGVRSVRLDDDASLLAVGFDRRSATMAEIVRALEDIDAPVVGVAQRDPRRRRARRRVMPTLLRRRGAGRLVR